MNSHREDIGAWPAELNEAYRQGQLLVFAGSDVSTAAGLPPWTRLAELLADHARSRGATEATLRELADLVSRGRRTDALSAAKAALGANEFYTLVENLWSDGACEVPLFAHAIAALAPKLSGLLTTSIDHLLERAFGGRWPVLHRITGDLAQRRGIILKLHGTLLDRSTWFLTRDDHDRQLFSDAGALDALSALFRARTVLFVGHDFCEDDSDRIFARARSSAIIQAPRHFALIPDRSLGPARRRALEASGVTFITYRNPRGGHAEAVSLLRALAPTGSMDGERQGAFDAKGVLDEAPPPAKPAPGDSRLDPKRLRQQIEETFSFEELEVFFAEAFPEIRGGIASIVAPTHNATYRAFKLVQYFERRRRLRELDTKLREYTQ
ncbi:SIR2 family NAD-dependent protein deacylase [Sorangium cellulosum]|uniref:SIR2 family NAD-dependent protein deacylase n=1 Tax=Sorangium cellulosum TaxID=56 RepID=UPI0013315456|nr:SIR2 family protein [Sorangium cellulosum]